MEKAGSGSALLNSKVVLPAGACITACSAIYPPQLISLLILCIRVLFLQLPLAPLTSPKVDTVLSVRGPALLVLLLTDSAVLFV